MCFNKQQIFSDICLTSAREGNALWLANSTHFLYEWNCEWNWQDEKCGNIFVTMFWNLKTKTCVDGSVMVELNEMDMSVCHVVEVLGWIVGYVTGKFIEIDKFG